MIKVYKYSQLERLHYLRPVADNADPDQYGAPNLGYYLTYSELEQFARDAFEAGQDHVYYLHHSGSKSPSFEGFWEKKSLEIEK